MDDATHTITQCPKWEEDRRGYEDTWGPIDEELLIQQLAENLEKRQEFILYVETVMRKKEELHARREKEQRQNRDRINS